jgi:hypothetical protein
MTLADNLYFRLHLELPNPPINQFNERHTWCHGILLTEKEREGFLYFTEISLDIGTLLLKFCSGDLVILGYMCYSIVRPV